MEEYQIKDVGERACPLHLTLERVAATPGGTVVACWQARVLDGCNWPCRPTLLGRGGCRKLAGRWTAMAALLPVVRPLMRMAPQLLVRSHMRRPLQIANGTDVSQLRAWLREALPQASRRQVVTDQAILHTTLARIVAPPPPTPAASLPAVACSGSRRII
jgi:hypothetical protein